MFFTIAMRPNVSFGNGVLLHQSARHRHTLYSASGSLKIKTDQWISLLPTSIFLKQAERFTFNARSKAIMRSKKKSNLQATLNRFNGHGTTEGTYWHSVKRSWLVPEVSPAYCVGKIRFFADPAGFRNRELHLHNVGTYLKCFVAILNAIIIKTKHRYTY